MANDFADVANLIERNDRVSDVYSELSKLIEDDNSKLLNDGVTHEWVEYLRSGKYVQRQFHTTGPSCALGILCELTNPTPVKLSRWMHFKNFVFSVFHSTITR